MTMKARKFSLKNQIIYVNDIIHSIELSINSVVVSESGFDFLFNDVDQVKFFLSSSSSAVVFFNEDLAHSTSIFS